MHLRLAGSAPFPPDVLPLGIVTAYNPASSPLPPAENMARDAALRERLRRLGLPCVRTLAGGTGADARSWDEPGYALLRAPRDTVARLGTMFGQNAVVWVDERGRALLIATRPGFCGAMPGETV